MTLIHHFQGGELLHLNKDHFEWKPSLHSEEQMEELEEEFKTWRNHHIGNMLMDGQVYEAVQFSNSCHREWYLREKEVEAKCPS